MFLNLTSKTWIIWHPSKIVVYETETAFFFNAVFCFFPILGIYADLLRPPIDGKKWNFVRCSERVASFDKWFEVLIFNNCISAQKWQKNIIKNMKLQDASGDTILTKLNNYTVIIFVHITLCNDTNFFECQVAKDELPVLPSWIVLCRTETDYFFCTIFFFS